MTKYSNNDHSARMLSDATCRMALAGLLHDLGKFAERADMPVQNRETLEANKQIDCPNPKPHPGSPGWFTHVHAAYTALALDVIESDLPPIGGQDASPFQEWGEAYAGGADDSLINAAAKHHKPDTFLQWVVATADRAASGLDREQFDRYNTTSDESPTSGKTHYTTRQYTLFEQIDPRRGEDGGRPKPAWDYRYRLEPLSPRSIFPVRADGYETNDRDAGRAEYAALWKRFRDMFPRIPRSHQQNLSLWLDHFDALWMTFTHAVPAATAFGAIPDVSLYDHSRVVAALAAAIWRYHHERDDEGGEALSRMASRQDWDEAKLLFIQGDLFGIQAFIFASGGASTKRAAKLLRGRSFVTLLAECAALRILDALSLPPTSQIVNAAGKFQIIAPNTVDTVSRLSEVRRALDEWFLQHTFGQSGIGIAWTEASCNDLQQGSRESRPYRHLVERLFRALDAAKLRRFDLCGGSAPSPIFADYLGRVGEHGICAVDDRTPADAGTLDDDPDPVSCLARDQIRIGDLLTKKHRDRLLITRDALDGPNVDALTTDIFGFRVGFTGSEEASGRFGRDAAAGNLLRAWDLSLPGDPEEPLFHGYARRDVNAWVPRVDEETRCEEVAKSGPSDPREAGRIKDFNEIASDAREHHELAGASKFDRGGLSGVPALMTLKGDVDNLGAIFQRGLDAPSLSRMAALSRQMNAFFAIYLPYLCRAEFRNVYTVFAGGDDFFLIGPWTTQMDLAARLRTDFCRYVAGNGGIGFSTGLAMTKPGLPVRRIEAMAEASLEDAKAFRRGEERNGRAKDAVTCFDRTVDWSDYRCLLEAGGRLQELLADMSQGYVYGLLSLVEQYEGVNKHPENALWRSRFYYNTVRALERRRGLGRSERQRRMDSLAAEIVEGGIERFGGDYRIALFSHLYRNRMQEG